MNPTRSTRPTLAANLLIAVAFALAAASILPAWADCEPIDHSGEFEDRFGRSTRARTDEQLRALYETPTVIEASAVRTDEEGARLQTLTETHAVFPVAAEDLMKTLTANDHLTEFMPNLSDHEVVCHPAENVSRQRQRTDFGLLIFSLGTEYVIDVHYPFSGPDRYGSHWVLVDSLDDRMSFIYGSWYFETIRLDGRSMTYVRHYARTGLTTSVPGVRVFIEPRLQGEVTALFDAFYEETLVRHGKIANN